jgi:predicted enzyme related to lactoylglutathione lyase
MHLVFVLDCNDADTLAGFWATALRYRRGPYDPPYVSLEDPVGAGPKLLLQQVPEPKTGKNRMHLDIKTTHMDPEVARLSALGAVILEKPHEDNGSFITVMADPAGNEFCVIA